MPFFKNKKNTEKKNQNVERLLEYCKKLKMPNETKEKFKKFGEKTICAEKVSNKLIM